MCERTKGRFAVAFKVTHLSKPDFSYQFISSINSAGSYSSFDYNNNNVSLSSERSCDFRTVFQQRVSSDSHLKNCLRCDNKAHVQQLSLPLQKKRSGAVSSPGVAASNTGSLQACWVIIEAANENQRLTKAELMTSAFLGGALSSPQQVTRCQKNTCQTLFWEMKSCV